MASLKGSMGGVTLERSKLDLRQKVQTQEPKLSNDGGGGGIGNKIFNGGGGDGDDGDDDDYFNFGDDGGDGDESFWRTAVSCCHKWTFIFALWVLNAHLSILTRDCRSCPITCLYLAYHHTCIMLGSLLHQGNRGDHFESVQPPGWRAV